MASDDVTTFPTNSYLASLSISLISGIWWSFVSMTTVGYGDKSPKSPAGRVFSVIWILVGIVFFSIISGKLTTVILQANTVEEHDMAGEKVGVLRNRLYDKGLVTRHGGNCITQTAMSGKSAP